MWESLLYPEVEKEWPLAPGCWLGLCIPAERGPLPGAALLVGMCLSFPLRLRNHQSLGGGGGWGRKLLSPACLPGLEPWEPPRLHGGEG